MNVQVVEFCNIWLTIVKHDVTADGKQEKLPV